MKALRLLGYYSSMSVDFLITEFYGEVRILGIIEVTIMLWWARTSCALLGIFIWYRRVLPRRALFGKLLSLA